MFPESPSPKVLPLRVIAEFSLSGSRPGPDLAGEMGDHFSPTAALLSRSVCVVRIVCKVTAPPCVYLQLVCWPALAYLVSYRIPALVFFTEVCL